MAIYSLHEDVFTASNGQVAECAINGHPASMRKHHEPNARFIAASKKMAEALLPFASFFEGDLSSVGGGTLVSPTFTVQQFKDAKAALLAAGYTEES